MDFFFDLTYCTWETLKQIVSFFDAYIRPIFFFIATTLAIHLGFLKIGSKVLATYSFGSASKFSTSQIISITFKNKKDKPISILSIYAVISKKYKLNLLTNDPPIILKGLEAVSIAIPQYSKAIIGESELSHEHIHDIQIYISSGDGVIKCKGMESNDNELPGLTNATRITNSFAGVCFNENTAFILEYVYNDKQHTAFIDKSGLIGNQWIFSINKIDSFENEDSIKNFLHETGLDQIFSNYICYKVTGAMIANFELMFKKQN